MDAASQQQIYVSNVNGVPIAEFGNGYNTPYGYQKVDYAGLGQTALSYLDYLKGQIDLFTSRYGATSSSPGANTLGLIQQYNALGGDAAYQQLQSGQYSPDVIGTIFPQLDKQQLTQFSTGQTVDSGYITDPKTGNMTTQATLDQQAQYEAGVANGTLKNIGTTDAPLYVPTGSAADTLNTGLTNGTVSPTDPTAQYQASLTGNNVTAPGIVPSAPTPAPTGLQMPTGDAAGAIYNPDTGQQEVNGVPIKTTDYGSPTQGTSGGVMTPDLSQSPPNPAGTSFTPTGNTQYDTLLQQLQTYLDKLTANGQTINPNVQITPEQIAQFTAQAAAQIHPYYATQLKAATSQFLGNLGYDLNSYNKQVSDAEIQYGRQLDSLASNSADAGFAQSGIRQKQEGQLATDTQSSLDTSRAALMNSATNNAASFAQDYGGTNVPTAPLIGSAPRVLPGQNTFDTSSTNSGLYTLDPAIYQQLIGSQQNAEKSATDTLSSQLQSNYLQQQANNTTRTLNTV